jgi:pentose-5-phosphate-3-epimerase
MVSLSSGFGFQSFGYDCVCDHAEQLDRIRTRDFDAAVAIDGGVGRDRHT